MICYNFMLSGLLGACLGIMLAAYAGGAFEDIGDSYLLSSVAALLVGGVPVSGGKASVAGCLSGALVMTMLITVLQVSHLSVGLQDLVEGVVVIAIVIFAQLGRSTGRD
jgi:ribose transport system permease protein